MMGKLFGPRHRDGRGRRKPVQLRFEAMESRLLLATTFLVTNTDDSGISRIAAASYPRRRMPPRNPPRSIFRSVRAVFRRSPRFRPCRRSRAPVIIDGTSQPGFDPNHPTPMIELTGSNIADPNSKWPDDQRRQQHGEGNGDQQVHRVGASGWIPTVATWLRATISAPIRPGPSPRTSAINTTAWQSDASFTTIGGTNARRPQHHLRQPRQRRQHRPRRPFSPWSRATSSAST